MSEIVTLSQLEARIAEPKSLPSLTGSAAGISQPAADPRDFIAPNLEVAPGGAAAPSVLLVSAPAAVGKSWLSQHLSHATGNPYWDLSEFRVGSNFFSGTLVKAYGGLGYATIETALDHEDVTIVVDAADEALVRVGASNFEAAIEDLASLLGTRIRARPAVVMFGRPETIEIAAAALEQFEVPWQILRVDYFDEESARHFVKKKVAGAGSEASEVDLDELLSSFFVTALEALGEESWEVHRTFLGYSPVLDAIAEFAYRSENPHLDLSKLLDQKGDLNFWALMARIVSGICDRETLRFERTFGDGDETRARVARETFTLDLQLSALLARRLDDAVIIPGPSVPEELRDDLVDAIHRQLSEHPFIRRASDRGRANPLMRFGSPVFRDFAVAWAVGWAEPDVRAAVELWCGDSALNPTPMAFRFLTVDLVSEPGAILQGSSIAVIAQSASSDEAQRLALAIRLDDADEADVHRGQMDLIDGALKVVSVDVELAAGQAIHLYRRVANVDLQAPDVEVVLGGELRDLVLGPDVSITADVIRVSAEDVRVGKDGGNPVFIDSGTFVSTQARLTVFDEAALRITSPGLYFPWQKYSAESNVAVDERELVEAAIELRRVMRRFNRSSRAGRLTYPEDAMDTVLRKRRVSQEMFDHCVNVGVIERRGHALAFVEPPNASAIEAADLSDGDLRGFLSRYLGRS